ncbi:hypothetical protein FRX31_029755 [Thalictrum thalictroides]|uniref:RNase H type-1 domain-containing protein n=1 Tax=Thalictrum thalictroides TaxID=46969 RepID=A0A7J6V7M0_THATH|nr:hypothetical protein FRX31_029755 [Thalictrum thalictroides]
MSFSSIVWKGIKQSLGLGANMQEWMRITIGTKGKSLRAEMLKDVEDSIENRILLERLGMTTLFKRKVTKTCKWYPPTQDTYKLNCDGALNDNGPGYGGLIRDWQGNVHIGTSTVKEVIFLELKAIAEGITLAKELQKDRLLVHSDSLWAIQVINKQTLPQWSCLELVRRLDDIKHEFNFIQFEHSYRECNQDADYLAGQEQFCNFCSTSS